MERVLVVDDDPAVCELIQDILQEVQLEAVCVGDDQAAYRVLPTLPTFQAMVVDVNLGSSTSGFDVARFARQVIPGLPVLYVTGAASPEVWAGAVTAGVWTLLVFSMAAAGALVS